jgi:glycosyltransferase involved in cell wall biosynthesis
MAKTVLFLNNWYEPLGQAGPAWNTRILAEAWQQGGDRAVVVSRGATPQFVQEVLNGVTVYRLPLRSQGQQQRVLLDRIIGAEQPDIVQTCWLGDLSWPMVAESIAHHRLRWVHLVQEYGLLCRIGTMFASGANCLDICAACQAQVTSARAWTASIDAVVGLSRFTLDKHLQHGLFANAQPCQVIYNAQPRQQPPPRFAPRASRRLRLGFLGRVVPEKGVEVLLREITGLPDQNEIEVTIAGACPPGYQRHLRAICPVTPLVFLGFVPQAQFFTRVDLCVVPSIWHDPLTRVVAESYSYGVPVLASNRGGIPEIVIDGETGFVIDPELAGDLGAKIDRLRHDTDELLRLQKRAYTASEQFIPERIIQQYRAVYFPSATFSPA